MSLIDNIRTFLFAEGDETQTVLGRRNLMKEVGESGTPNFHGIITQDYNQNLRGQSAITIFEEMRRSDATVNATLNALKLPILSAERRIEPTDQNDERQVEIAEFVRSNLFERLNFENFLREAMAYKDFGFYYFEKVYEIRNGQMFIKKLAARQPSAHLYWMMRDGSEGVTQQLPSVHDLTKTMNPEIPRSKLLLFVNDMEGDNFDGVSVLRSAYKHWYLKDVLYKLDGIKHERGAGILKITLPESSTDDDKNDAKELGKNFKNSESSYVIQPSPSWDVTLMTSGISDQSSALMDSVQHHDRMIAKNILAQFLDLGGSSTGSFALSKDQTNFFTLSLRATANYIAEVINDELIKELVTLNFGEQEEYPRLEFSKIGEIDYTEMSATLEKLINIGLVEKSDNLKVWTHNTFGLPELNLDDLERAAKENKEAAPAPVAVEEVEQAKKKDEIQEEPEEIEAAELAVKRELTLAEGRVKFTDINKFFTETEDDVAQTLNAFTEKQKEGLLKEVERIVTANDITAIAGLSIASTGSMKANLKDTAKTSHEEGKATAALEIGESIPTTPKVNNRLRSTKIDIAVDTRNQSIESVIQRKMLDLVTKGIGATAAVFEISKLFDKVTSKQDSHLTGSIVEDNVNSGRDLVFGLNVDKIHGLQRSEILDVKTCPICLSLDGRVIDAKDPFAKIGQIHTSCRGLWVAVLKSDAELPAVKALPKSILNRFDTIEGVPITNDFAQLKSPVITKSSRLNQKIEDGTITNPNLS